jgi:hypothetical protein
MMRTIAGITIAIALCGSAAARAQETKPLPKDSVRVSIPGCTKGYIFTVGHRTQDEPGTVDLPEGMHLRMNAPKKMIAEIKAQEGSMIQIVGVMKKGQINPTGVRIGGGVTVSPGPTGPGGSLGPGAGVSQSVIDVEGWRPVAGSCPSK